jgi:uncharacterized protein (TIGR02246 family)
MRYSITNSAALLLLIAAGPLWAADDPEADLTQRKEVLALLQQVQGSFNAGDAPAVAACWAEAGEFVGPEGARVNGRKDIESHFHDALASRKMTLHLHLNHLRLVNPQLALVDAGVDIEPGTVAGNTPSASFVLSKEGGRWQIESVRESQATSPPQTSHLKDLAWMIGSWSSETAKNGLVLHTSCEWTATQAFLIRKFTLEGKGAFVHGGTEVIGWDPRSSRIRSWLFDTDGGFGENIWVREGNRWLIKYSGTLADGRSVTSTQILTIDDSDTITMESKDRTVDGTPQPDIPVKSLHRQTAAKASRQAGGINGKPVDAPAHLLPEQ